MKQIIFLFLSVVLVVNLFSLSGDDQNGKTANPWEKNTNHPIDDTYLFFEGVVSAAQVLKMKTPSSGTVAVAHAAVGDRVKTTQLLLTLKSTDSEGEIKKAEAYLKIWEKTLYNRQHWKVRSGAAERQAERKIKEAKEALAKLREKYADIKIYSLISGKVGFLVTPGTEVKEDSVVAEIWDDSTLKTSFSSDSEVVSKYMNHFKDGQIIPLTFKEVDGEFSGVIKKSRKTINIKIANPDFVLSVGMKARFGLKRSDIQPETVAQIQPSVKETRPSSTKPKKPVPRGEIEIKKREYEVSLGLSLAFSEELYYRLSGIDNLISQYAQNYGVEYTASGSFSKSMIFFPIQALVNFHLKKNIFLKGGLEYGFSNSSPQNLYRVEWTGNTEEHDYSLTNKLSYIMPFVGGELRFSSFGVYANLGLNFLSLNYQQNVDYSDGAYWSQREDTIKASGIGFGFLLGGKYRIQLKKKIDLLVKIEFLYLSVGSFSGTRDSTISDSTGASFSESIDGDIYSYEMNPYYREWFYHWDLFSAAPSDDWYRSVGKLSLNLYCIRLLFGIVF
jgi:biotin carboxyl carrier protein